MTPKEQTELIDALLDGDISEADFLRIEAELSVDADVRKAYYNRMKLDLLLEKEAAEPSVDLATQSPNRPDPKLRSSRVTRAVGIFIVLAATIVGVVFLTTPDTDRDKPTGVTKNEIEPTAIGFALLGGQSDAVWEGQQMGTGSLVPSGELHLKSGLAHLELFSGVQMVIQGDAVFSIDSAMEVSLKRGRVSAHVPDAAHGFRVKTSHGDVVDLGTEFALKVTEESSRVEVVTGEVELHLQGSNTHRMFEGETLELSNAGKTAIAQVEKLSLISPDAFKRELALRQSDHFKRWQSHAESLRHDNRLVAYYRVDSKQPLSRQLTNLADSDGAKAGNGAIVACERTKNRWGHADGALDFSRMGSRVRVNVQGEYRGVTLLCWVKINSLDRQFNSLFLTDGHELQEPHWQIMDDGRLFFSVKKYDKKTKSTRTRNKHNFYSPVFWDSSLSGKWLMLATVYDVDAKQVTHYVNGEAIGIESVPDDYLVETVRIGSASIANWSEPMYRTDPEFVVRNLNGSIDEFALFAGALSSEEIAEHFRIGNPN